MECKLHSQTQRKRLQILWYSRQSFCFLFVFFFFLTFCILSQLIDCNELENLHCRLFLFWLGFISVLHCSVVYIALQQTDEASQSFQQKTRLCVHNQPLTSILDVSLSPPSLSLREHLWLDFVWLLQPNIAGFSCLLTASDIFFLCKSLSCFCLCFMGPCPAPMFANSLFYFYHFWLICKFCYWFVITITKILTMSIFVASVLMLQIFWLSFILESTLCLLVGRCSMTLLFLLL